MRRLAIITTLLLVSTHLSLAQERPEISQERRQAAQAFIQEHGTQWQVRWSAKTGTPATLMGGKARGYNGAPRQAGRAFLQDYKKLFGIEDAQQNLEVARQNASKGNTRVLYRQVYKGMPVLHSGYLVAINRAGAVYYVSGDYYPDIKVSTAPSLSPSRVVSHMRTDLRAVSVADSFKVLQAPTLSIYVGEKGDSLTYHLAYEAEAERRRPLKVFRYIIDAQSGEVLYKTSLVEDASRFGKSHMTHARHSGSERGRETDRHINASAVNGSGEVYTTNPLHGSPVSKTLHRLEGFCPPFFGCFFDPGERLYGDNVEVYDHFGDHATSSNGTFNYSPSNFRFDQVMVYRHSDEFEAWLIGSLGMETDRVDGQVDAETRSDVCYACTIPSQRDAYFSDASGYFGVRNPTREAAVVTHEYMHIVTRRTTT